MDRRKFLQSALAAGAVYGTGTLPRIIASASAQGNLPTMTNRVIVNVMLNGGPDWRHVMPPAWDETSGSYGNAFWNVRARSFSTGGSINPNTLWADNYHPFEANGTTFGIARNCGWLARMFANGNVAIVNNVFGLTNRDHSHAQLALNQGNRSSGANDANRSGWGGRLASVMNGNVLSLTSSPSAFCNGLHPDGDINQFYVGNQISASDTRNMSLYRAQTGNDPRWDSRGNVTRALRTYYAAKRNEVSADSPYARALQHEATLREFGQQIDERLATLPEPESLRALHHWSGEDRLERASFGRQLRNLYDAYACSDILGLRVASLDYDGWDTHDSQAARIESNLHDMFGDDRGFDRLWQLLPDDVKNRSVFVFAGEFGRQLRANGGGGTDHGRGTSYIIVGRPVNGGVYGDMFPEAELARHGQSSPDIAGLTHFDHVLGEICDWASAGSSATVFPARHTAQLEAGLGIDQLFG